MLDEVMLDAGFFRLCEDLFPVDHPAAHFRHFVERVAEILRESANDKHTAELRRIERVTGVKLAAAEVVAMEADRTMSC